MEKHQILKPRQTRGTPGHLIFTKLGIASIVATVVGYFISEYFRGERAVKRVESGRFLNPDHIRYQSLLMSNIQFHDKTTAAKIRQLQDDGEWEFIEQNSITAPP